ncbi:hypothetical protein [Streptomyces sp. ME19-01-6]|uniref:hypothetical protein n=1 Tax=Streptomyces sp. ME19-01-6 TaxID=3028686 RepID=UPI0029ACA977|nr:hypothetical protein [Streptomyces sp. ME19-01-6]MDX3233441.1 hypothetical protein [Streptomyces sp. ME19-01-6]
MVDESREIAERVATLLHAHRERLGRVSQGTRAMGVCCRWYSSCAGASAASGWPNSAGKQGPCPLSWSVRCGPGDLNLGGTEIRTARVAVAGPKGVDQRQRNPARAASSTPTADCSAGCRLPALADLGYQNAGPVFHHPIKKPKSSEPADGDAAFKAVTRPGLTASTDVADHLSEDHQP